MTWESIAKKQRKCEVVSIIIFIAFIIYGITSDCIVKHGIYLIYVEAIDGISLVILQIQGTIDTLSIAILSLLGGRVSEIYMGIPLIDFTLNRKPIYLKQKRIIILLIFLLCVNIILHIFGLYNTVFTIFLITAGLIVISIREIYEVFSGHVAIEDEIKGYLTDRIKNGTHDEYLDMMHKFCNDWKQTIATQTEPEYETYRQIFDMLFKKLFQDEVPNSRTELQNYIYPSIRTLLCAEMPVSRKRGLSFLNEIYQNAWNCILECRTRKTQNGPLEFSDGFHLFHAVCYHLQEVVESLPIAEVDQELKWFDTVEFVFLVNYWIAEETKDQGELFATAHFARAMGYYLAKNRNQGWHADKWGKPFVSLRLPTCPPEKAKELEQQWSETLLNYAISLVNCNMLYLLEESLYVRRMAFLRRPVESWKARLILEIHCYIYYFAEYETTACISKNLKRSCQNFLRKYKIRKNFSIFLNQISNSKDILNPNLEKHLFEKLTRFELFPREEMSKQMVMETVVHNFVVFIALHLYGEYDPYHMMEQIFSDEFVKFYLTEYIKSPEEVIKRLDTFFHLINTAETSDKVQIQKKSRAQYTVLEQMTKQRLKTILMKKALDYPQENVQASLKGLAQQIERYINEKFALIQSEEAKSAPECKICCFKLNTIADMKEEDYLSNYFNEIADGMLYGLCKYLIKIGSLQKISRKNFLNDADYISYIKNSGAGIILGSRQMFMTERYNDQEILDQYLEERKIVFVGYHNIGMLLKEDSLQIHVEKVNISVRPVLLKESGAKYDPEHDEYRYNTFGTELIYKREELVNYLKHSRKMIHVAIRLSIKKTKGTIGTVVCLPLR